MSYFCIFVNVCFRAAVTHTVLCRELLGRAAERFSFLHISVQQRLLRKTVRLLPCVSLKEAVSVDISIIYVPVSPSRKKEKENVPDKLQVSPSPPQVCLKPHLSFWCATVKLTNVSVYFIWKALHPMDCQSLHALDSSIRQVEKMY